MVGTSLEVELGAAFVHLPVISISIFFGCGAAANDETTHGHILRAHITILYYIPGRTLLH